MTNLVLVRAGDSSRHETFVGSRDSHHGFDVLVDYFGDVEGRYSATSDHYFWSPRDTLRGKRAMHRLLQENPHLIDRYDHFWFVDDDIESTPDDVATMFAAQERLAVDLAQPALSLDSYYTFHALLKHQGFAARFTNFVEVMVPSFSRRALAACLPTFALSDTGWGVDWGWQTLLSRAGMTSAVLDCVAVRHTRPVRVGDLYHGLPEHPVAHGSRIADQYGVTLDHAVLVERGIDDAFAPVPDRDLHAKLLIAAPAARMQDPFSWDVYLDTIRRGRDQTQSRLARRSTGRNEPHDACPLGSARAEAFDAELRSALVQSEVTGPPSFDDDVAIIRSSWKSRHVSDVVCSLPDVDAHEVLHEARGPVSEDSPWLELAGDVAEDLAARRSLARVLAHRLRREGSEPVTIGIPHAHDDMHEVLTALTTAPDLRLVIFTPLHVDPHLLASDLVAGCAELTIDLEQLDVEIRHTDADPCIDTSLAIALDVSPHTWRPGHPLLLTTDQLRRALALRRATSSANV